MRGIDLSHPFRFAIGTGKSSWHSTSFLQFLHGDISLLSPFQIGTCGRAVKRPMVGRSENLLWVGRPTYRGSQGRPTVGFILAVARRCALSPVEQLYEGDAQLSCFGWRAMGKQQVVLRWNISLVIYYPLKAQGSSSLDPCMPCAQILGLICRVS